MSDNPDSKPKVIDRQNENVSTSIVLDKPMLGVDETAIMGGVDLSVSSSDITDIALDAFNMATSKALSESKAKRNLIRDLLRKSERQMETMLVEASEAATKALKESLTQVKIGETPFSLNFTKAKAVVDYHRFSTDSRTVERPLSDRWVTISSITVVDITDPTATREISVLSHTDRTSPPERFMELQNKHIELEDLLEKVENHINEITAARATREDRVTNAKATLARGKLEELGGKNAEIAAHLSKVDEGAFALDTGVDEALSKYTRSDAESS